MRFIYTLLLACLFSTGAFAEDRPIAIGSKIEIKQEMIFENLGPFGQIEGDRFALTKDGQRAQVFAVAFSMGEIMKYHHYDGPNRKACKILLYLPFSEYRMNTVQSVRVSPRVLEVESYAAEYFPTTVYFKGVSLPDGTAVKAKLACHHTDFGVVPTVEFVTEVFSGAKTRLDLIRQNEPSIPSLR